MSGFSLPVASFSYPARKKSLILRLACAQPYHPGTSRHGHSVVHAGHAGQLMRPNKAETAVHGCHCPGDMAVRMRKVLARPWVGVRVCHLLSLLICKLVAGSFNCGRLHHCV